MSHLNVEIKARCERLEAIREILTGYGADFRGTDEQVDTYFNVPSGRMKLREGHIEYALIHYDRPDQAGPKDARVHLFHPRPGPDLKPLLTAALGVLAVVRKTRDIYFVENVKIHLDTVDELGSFLEIEAIDYANKLGHDHLLQQCTHYMQLFGVADSDLITNSYSDMLMELKQGG